MPVSKGAPQVILQLATDKEQVSGDVNKSVDDFASRGYRSLGVARADDRGDALADEELLPVTSSDAWGHN